MARLIINVMTGEITRGDAVGPFDSLEAERETMVVTPFQAKSALSDAGHLTAVELLIAASDAATQLAWNEAVEFRRNSPLIITLGASLGLDEFEIDALFRAAAVIQV